MDRTISATVDASPDATMATLADLGTYPAWLTLVNSAEPDRAEPGSTEPGSTEPDRSEPDGDTAWLVTLRARLGPLARSKRLRMVRTELDTNSVRFERVETDGRDHAAWVLTATLDPIDDNTSAVKVNLHYGGALWSAPLEIVLASFEGSAGDRLTAYLSTTD